MKYRNHSIKKIINNEIKQIIKHLERLLGKKIIIEECNINMLENKINLIINYDDKNSLVIIKAIKNKDNAYDILIASKYDNNHPIKYVNYELTNGVFKKKNSNYYYKNNNLLISVDSNLIGVDDKVYSFVTLTKDDIVVKLRISEDNCDFLFEILKLSNLDFKNIYNSLKVIDKVLVSNIRIEVFNKKTLEKNVLSTNNGILVYYEKVYQINGKEVVIAYENNKIKVSTICDFDDNHEDILSNINPNEKIESVKKFIK